MIQVSRPDDQAERYGARRRSMTVLLSGLREGHADHAVAGNDGGELLLRPTLGAGRTFGQHEVAHIGVRIVGAVLVAFPLALTLGTLAAYYVGRAPDRVATGIAVIGISVPNYWFAIVLIIIFAVELHVLPATAYASASGSFSL